LGITEECSQIQQASYRAENSPRFLSQRSKRSDKYKARSHQSHETYATKDQVHCAVKGHASPRAYRVNDKDSNTYLADSKDSK
jgi:hypothetical protein